MTNFITLFTEIDHNNSGIMLAITGIVMAMGLGSLFLIGTGKLLKKKYNYYRARIYITDPDLDRALKQLRPDGKGRCVRKDPVTGELEMKLRDNDMWVAIDPPEALASTRKQILQRKKVIELHI